MARGLILKAILLKGLIPLLVPLFVSALDRRSSYGYGLGVTEVEKIEPG